MFNVDYIFMTESLCEYALEVDSEDSNKYRHCRSYTIPLQIDYKGYHTQRMWGS